MPFWGGEQQSDHLAFLCAGWNWDRLLTSSPCGAELCNCLCLPVMSGSAGRKLLWSCVFCNRYCCAGESLLVCEVELLSLQSVHPVLPDQCWGLAEASESIITEASWIPFFLSCLLHGRPEEMVIFAEVICPLWTLLEWADELHSTSNETSARCHQRDKFCPQMSEWARNSQLCTCVWWPYVSHLLSIELRSLNLQTQCWESVLQYLGLLFNFHLSRSFASWLSYN